MLRRRGRQRLGSIQGQVGGRGLGVLDDLVAGLDELEVGHALVATPPVGVHVQGAVVDAARGRGGVGGGGVVAGIDGHASSSSSPAPSRRRVAGVAVAAARLALDLARGPGGLPHLADPGGEGGVLLAASAVGRAAAAAVLVMVVGVALLDPAPVLQVQAFHSSAQLKQQQHVRYHIKMLLAFHLSLCHLQ